VGIGAHFHMDSDVAAVRSGLSAVSSAAQPCVSKRDGPPAVREPCGMQTRPGLTRMGYKQAGPFRWGELVKCDELIQVLAAWAARGPLGGEWPDVLGGKARRIYVLVSQRRAGRDPGRHTRPGAPSPRIEIRPKQQTGKREQPDNTRSSVNVSRSGGVAGR
jgi:hypothetical protein